MNALQIDSLKRELKGDIASDPETLAVNSKDASIFEIIPDVVIYPKDKEDVENVVRFVNSNKAKEKTLSITARSAGTDMGGGPLNDSIILSFAKYFNKISEIKDGMVTVQPGVYYRDFEKLTVKAGYVFPSYPVSKELCALGGMIGNNCGGEKSLKYGQTERYVKKIKMVLSDGNEYEFKSLNKEELREKMSHKSFEGEIYRNVYNLINDNYAEIMNAKPGTDKNSAGYFLWNVYDKDLGTFDFTKLFTGSQGTLGIMTEATLELVPVSKHSQMLVIYLNDRDIKNLGGIINTVIGMKPESFETYDDNTLALAVKYFPEFSKKLGKNNVLSTLIEFLPEIVMALLNRLPKLVLQAEFTGNDVLKLKDDVKKLQLALRQFNLKTKIAGDENRSKKYWLIRRESFSLLKDKIKDKHASPFIDDIVVEPKYLSEFLPKLDKLIEKYPSIISTVAGHIGNGNFHIIPLVDIKNEKDRQIIKDLGKEVYDLVFEYHGTTNGEHNDGLIRSPYLKKMYGERIYKLFEETKRIFDPDNIFNPGKKVNSRMEYSMNHIRRDWQE